MHCCKLLLIILPNDSQQKKMVRGQKSLRRSETKQEMLTATLQLQATNRG